MHYGIKQEKIIAKSDKINFTEKRGQPLVIALGALKGSSTEELLPCLTELGADEIHIFLQKGAAKHRINPKTSARWYKIIQTSSEQCKRDYLPKLNTWENCTSFLESMDSNINNRFFLDPTSAKPLVKIDLQTGGVCLCVGPEAGLLESDLETLKRNKFMGARLSQNILRSFTASIAALSIISSKTL